MHAQTSFQKKYPLSVRRKFWKKMLTRLPFPLFPSYTLGFIGAWVGNMMASGVLSSTIEFTDAEMDQLVTGNFLAGLWQGALIGTLLTALLMGIYAVYVHYYIRMYYYDVTEQYVAIQKGVFAPTEIHIFFSKIQDVYVDQDIFDRVLGIYDVHIASASMTSNSAAHIDGVSADVADALKNMMLERIAGQGSGTTGGGQPQSVISSAVRQQTVVDTHELEAISIQNFPVQGIWKVASFIEQCVHGVIVLGFVIVGFTYEFLSPDALFVFIPIAALLLILANWAYFALWMKQYSFRCTGTRVEMQEGVIARRVLNVPYHTIQDVTLSQGIIDRIFGTYNVYIENASNQISGANGRPQRMGVSIYGQTQQNAEHIVQVFRKMLEGYNQSTGV